MSWAPQSYSGNPQGPIVQKKTGEQGDQFPNIYRRYHQPSGRFIAAQADSEGVTLPGHTRSFVRTWDADTVEGVQKTPVPMAGWQRGSIIRMGSPTIVLSSLGPMWDPTDPATWRPDL